MEAVEVISMSEQRSMVLIPSLLPPVLSLCATSALFLVGRACVALDPFTLSI